MEKIPPNAALWDRWGDPIISGPIPPGGRALTVTEWRLLKRATRRRTVQRRWAHRQATRHPKPTPEPIQRDTAAELHAAAVRAGFVSRLAYLQGEPTEVDMLPAPPPHRGRAYQAMLDAIEALPPIAAGSRLTPPPKPWKRERT